MELNEHNLSTRVWAKEIPFGFSFFAGSGAKKKKKETRRKGNKIIYERVSVCVFK